MNFIKNHRRGIALFSAFAFFWLVQASSLPLPAESVSSQPNSVSADQGSDYLEVVGQKAAPAKKKSVLPIVLIGVGLLTVTAVVLFLVVLKNYDIRGTWKIDLKWATGSDDDPSITFAGSKKSGTLTSTYDDTGTYSVDGKNVSWRFDWDTTFVWTGKFTGKDAMNGTVTWSSEGLSGTWTATRSSAATSVPMPGSWKKATR